MVEASYPGQEAKANDLLTFPTLMMGVGNLIAMPFANVIGRRPIFLASILVLMLAGLWCALSTSLSSHIAGRAIMSLAAGQSEALAPLIVQEIHYLHEKGRKLGWFIFIENVVAGTFFIVSTYMVSAWGWHWWYGFFCIMNAAVLVLSIVFVTETYYPRSGPPPALPAVIEEGLKGTSREDIVFTTSSTIVLDYDRYGHRTLRKDVRLFSVKPEWRQLPIFYKQLVQGFLVPSIFWLFLLNGAFLGIYVFEASTFSAILLSPPYLLSFNDLGAVQAGQIVCCLIFLPLLGYGSDWIAKAMSKQNHGNYKPEYRLLLLWIPAIIGIVCAILYGQAGAHPDSWDVSVPIVCYNASFFAFLGANVIGITYAVDSFPARAETLLVVICAGRGLISFGLSYAVLPSITAIGYDGAMNIQGGITGGLACAGVLVYIFGPKIRAIANRILGTNSG
jgi:hypothetical protein